VLVKEGFQKPFTKRRKPRKYKRYEWPLPNYMWHTDWHVIKSEKHKGENIIVYLDDCSRMAMGYCTGAENTNNSLSSSILDIKFIFHRLFFSATSLTFYAEPKGFHIW